MQPPASTGPTRESLLPALAPVVFVLLWSTGFIGAKYGLPYAEPLTFLLIRFALVTAILGAWAMTIRAAWPTRAEMFHLSVVGVLLHGVYLGGVFWAISLGIEAGASALIVSVQPILTAVLAGAVLGERVTRWQWLGLAIGLLGVTLVVSEKLGAGLGNLYGVGLCLVALLGISVATVYQKRFCGTVAMPIASVIQFAAAGIAILPLALILETNRVVWSGEFVFALLWLVGVLSVGAVGLLIYLLKRGAASKVASLFFLVPPVTALIAWAMFGETMGPVALFGIMCVVIGVALAMRGPK